MKFPYGVSDFYGRVALLSGRADAGWRKSGWRADLAHSQLLDILLEFKFVKLSEVAQSGVEVRQMESAALLALDRVQAKIAEATPQLQR